MLNAGLRKPVVLAVSLPDETAPVCRRPLSGGSVGTTAEGCYFLCAVFFLVIVIFLYLKMDVETHIIGFQ
jgi:hypothetical protein